MNVMPSLWVAVFLVGSGVLPTVAWAATQSVPEGKLTGSGYCITHRHHFTPTKPCPDCANRVVPGGGPNSSQSQVTGVLGALISEMMRGDPGRAARLEAEEQERVLARQRAAVELARRKNEDFKRLRGQLKLDNFDGDEGGLKLKGVEDDSGGGLTLKLGDDGLKPLGTRAAPNSGPPDGLPPNTDAMVVDLRDLQKASFVVGAAESGAAEDAPLLFDEALRTANGDKTLSGGASAGAIAPDFQEKGLLAFQMANREYRKANDFRMKCSETFAQAQRQREIADWMAKEAMADLEKAKAGLADATTLREKQRLMAEVFAARKAVDEAWAKARAELDAARLRESQAKEEAIRVLRATVAKKDSATFHPPIPSLPQLDEKKWMQMQEKMVAQRAELEVRNVEYRKQLGGMEVPKPLTWERVHEGVLLGAGTDVTDAKKLENAVSPLTGKTTHQMNEAARVAKENGVAGVGGAMVVSFGTTKTGTIPQEAVEVTRVVGDHVTAGRVSLNTPEGKQAVASLAGKEFDRLIAHSNGASVTEALIREDLVKVNELNIVGGDRSLLNGHAFQNLLDTGKVKRVVVWVNLNDPVVWGTAPDQLKLAERGIHALDRIARKVTGDLAGGDSRVEYRYMWGKGEGILGPHYIETGYYPAMAKAMGAP